jgi:hypothetical protein
MKRLVLFSIAFIQAVAVSAQSNISSNDKIWMPAPTTIKDVPSTSGQKSTYGNIKSTNDKGLGERVLGTTTYDLQTNNTVHDRIVRDTNGNMSVAWIASLSTSSAFADRGTGYSHYDVGSDVWTLSPNYPRIESDRCGWPSILYDGNGGEIIISHSTASERLKLNSRSTIGAGSWSEKYIGTGWYTWNRAVMGGSDGNTIHMIVASTDADSLNNQNLTNAVLYFRSQDAGLTFDVVASILPGLDSGSVGTGAALTVDAYAIAANGNHVAFGVFNAFNDVILMESFDNGSTWTSKVVWDFPYKGYSDFAQNHDTTYIESCDGAGTIIIDDNDVVNMSWGRQFIFPDQAGAGYYRRSFTDSLRFYRNSSPSYIGFAGNWLDANADSMYLTTASYFGIQSSIITFPNLSASGDSLYLIYNSITDTLVSGINQARLLHVFLVRSGDNGATWSSPIDLTPGDQFAEYVFGDILPTTDDKLRMIYHRDAYPGNYLYYTLQTAPSANYIWQENVSDNDVIYLEITLGGGGIGIGLEKVLNPKNESGVYPNPSNGNVNLSLVLYQDFDVTIHVHDVNGKVVHTFNGDIKKGRNQIEMDLSHLDPGMYIVNIAADGEVLTEKVIIE